MIADQACCNMYNHTGQSAFKEVLTVALACSLHRFRYEKLQAALRRYKRVQVQD